MNTIFFSFYLFYSLLNPTASQLQRFEYTHPQMGTVFKLIFYTKDSITANTAAQTAFARIDALNQCLSDYLPESEINQLCHHAGNNEKIKASKDLWRILRLSHQFSKKSEGAFDVTVGAVTRLWRRARNLKELPDSTHLQQALQTVGFKKIKYFKLKKRVLLTEKGTKLDFGGIAQGYAADECLKIARSFGITAALADAGGDIALGDAPPNTQGWEIEVPTSAGTPKMLTLHNCGITTSGAKYRYLEINNQRYSHIIDPRTGWGLTSRVLVTVQAPNATIADAWATAIGVLGAKEWSKMAKLHPELMVQLSEEGL
jgi:FAD:protein FMN transferase